MSQLVLDGVGGSFKVMGMQSYVPIVASITESSLWREPPYVRVVFLTLLSLKDSDHIVRKEDHHLCFQSHVSDDEFLDAMRILSSPDTSSKIPQPHDGKRIERVKEGWFVINGDKYQTIMKECNRRSAASRRKREQRERDRVSQIIRSVEPLPKAASNGQPNAEGML